MRQVTRTDVPSSNARSPVWLTRP